MNDLTKLLEVLPEFEGVTVDELKRAELGVLSFAEIFDALRGTHEFLKNLTSQQEILKDDAYIPQTLVDTLKDRIQRFNNLAKQIREFDVAAGDPTPRRQSLISEVNSFKKDGVGALHPLRVLVQLRQLDPSNYTMGLKAMQTEVQSILKKLKEKDEEADKTLKSIKDISASSGAEAYSHVFASQAGKHKTAAWHWLLASMCFFVVIVIYLISLFINGIAASSNDLVQVVRAISLHALFLAAVYFALSQSVKNYNVNMHLEVVNEHLQNSLRTFEAFLHAATEPEVRSAVLLQATKSIFDPGKTGYLQKEGQVSYSFSVADIFKKI